MVLKVLEHGFSVCKIKDVKEVDFSDEFVFFSKTDEELSLVCRSDLVPKNPIALEDGWKGFRVQGELDFSLIPDPVQAVNHIGRQWDQYLCDFHL